MFVAQTHGVHEYRRVGCMRNFAPTPLGLTTERIATGNTLYDSAILPSRSHYHGCCSLYAISTGEGSQPHPYSGCHSGYVLFRRALSRYLRSCWEALSLGRMHMETPTYLYAWDIDIIDCLEEVKVEGEWSHSYPVEHLSLSKKRVASGAHRELFIWKRVEDLLTIEKELELSVLLDCDSDEEVIVTGLHWHGLGRRDAGMLITSFMHQGICIYDSRNWSVLRQIGEHRVGFMATSALSPDGTRIVVSNLINGVDVYDTDTGALILTVPHEIGKGHPLPVRFIHGGHAIASVNGVGCVKVWYIDGSSSRKLQTLAAPGNCRIMSLGARLFPVALDDFMIVAGTLAEDLQSPVLLWKAEEARTRGQYAVVADNGLDQHRSFFGSRMAKGMFFSCVVVAASAIALLLVYYYPHDASNMARHGPVYAQTNAHRLGTILLDIRHWQY
ncbi:hypothetical protein NUW54_g3561 [Trametes sanguinea]|uniref:Uncharacterized protein n=1 Tax=Trametes sanguinea TaxID=158606 RepID=A0ACC1Q233_9APHY|nr:hypothetical protein NUW54_g3561 [Trametes sanguinea]